MSDIPYFEGEISVSSGSRNMTVTDGDIRLISPMSLVFVGNPIMVARVESVEVSNNRLVLSKPWPYPQQQNVRMIAEPSESMVVAAANMLSEATEVTSKARKDGIATLDALKEVLTSTSSTVTVSTLEGDIDVKPWGRIKADVENEWEDIKQPIEAKISQLDVMEKVKRDATFYADFTNGEYIERKGLAGPLRQTFSSLINYTCPDPATGETPIGTIESVGANEPRLVSREGKSQGLLVEPASTNEIINSRWLNVTANSSPDNWVLTDIGDGEMSVEDGSVGNKKVLFSSNGESRIFFSQGLNFVQNEIYTISVYVEILTEGISYNNIFRTSATTDLGAVYLLGSEEVGINDELPVGRHRLEIVCNPTQTFTTGIRMGLGTNTSIEGRVLMEAPQFEKGYLTSYIPTEGSAVTRGQSSANSTLMNGKINDDLGTLYWEGVVTDRTDARGLIALGSISTATNNNVSVLIRQSETAQLFIGSDGGGTQTSITPVRGFSFNKVNKIAITYDFNSLIAFASINGSSPQQITINSKPSNFSDENNTLILGKFRRLADVQQGQSCSQSLYLPYALSPTELSALTTLEDE